MLNRYEMEVTSQEVPLIPNLEVPLQPSEEIKPKELFPAPELNCIDFLKGADPYYFVDPVSKKIVVLAQREENGTPYDGLNELRIYIVDDLEDLPWTDPTYVISDCPDCWRRENWAPEMVYEDGRYLLYIAASNGSNEEHRMVLYEAINIAGPYVFKDKVQSPAHPETDVWAIDGTEVQIPFNGTTKKYYVWSGWENANDKFPQRLYIAEMIDDVTLGKRQEIAFPYPEWTKSVKEILEGPQALFIDGEFAGFTFAADASWTIRYCTGILWWTGGDPLSPASWIMDPEPLFAPGNGIGHGMQIGRGEDEVVEFLIHRKTSEKEGWDDRKICKLEVPLSQLKHRRSEVLKDCPATHEDKYDEHLVFA